MIPQLKSAMAASQPQEAMFSSPAKAVRGRHGKPASAPHAALHLPAKMRYLARLSQPTGSRSGRPVRLRGHEDRSEATPSDDHR
ncbi:MAG TPA: hypothetical protein DIT03_07505 [Candidatus Accumulibacter sp.]|nr:hypothetical protein [Accumulibacter sp.]